jgi:hypothetical protein
MPRGKPGSGAVRTRRIRQDTVRHLVRDLCRDLFFRVCTDYDSMTIVKCIQPKDRVNFVLPRELLKYLDPEITYDQGEIEYNALLDDPELTYIYKKYDAVIIRNNNDL